MENNKRLIKRSGGFRKTEMVHFFLTCDKSLSGSEIGSIRIEKEKIYNLLETEKETIFNIVSEYLKVTRGVCQDNTIHFNYLVSHEKKVNAKCVHLWAEFNSIRSLKELCINFLCEHIGHYDVNKKIIIKDEERTDCIPEPLIDDIEKKWTVFIEKGFYLIKSGKFTTEFFHMNNKDKRNPCFCLPPKVILLNEPFQTSNKPYDTSC